MRDNAKALVRQVGLPRIIIAGFFLLLLVAAGGFQMDLLQLCSDFLRRWGMYGILALAMVPAVQCGIGLNFGISMGIVGGLLGGLIVIEFRLASIPALVENRWWEEGDGNVRWLNRYAQPLSTDEWQNGPKQLQILLSDRFLIAINATLEVTEIVLPAGEWHAIPPFAGEDNPVITAVWQGPAHGLCVFQR